MSVSFVSGSFNLANWGFSVGDIAAIAGAGRKAGTWLLAHFKDRILFEWMNVDVDAVCSRKGLIDTTELHKRWDQQFVLLKNGKRFLFQSRDGTNVPIVQQMDRFTWLMTLFTAAFDSSMETKVLRKVLTLFLLKLFEENESGLESLRQEATYHIEGWTSAACVRSISMRARSIWKQLEIQQKHQPGFIPEAEANHICQFMIWLVSGESKVFLTASTDILCLAMILEDLGMMIKTTETSASLFDEGEVVVAWNSAVIPVEIVKTHPISRPGMRIPLGHMEEVASLFHADRNRLRDIFEKGMRAVKQDQLLLKPEFREANNMFHQPDLSYYFRREPEQNIPRLSGILTRFAKWMFPTLTPAACNALISVYDEVCRSQSEQRNIDMLSLSLESQSQGNGNPLHKNYDYGNSLVYFQAFFLGYWYQLLLPLLDTSQLSTQEAYGMWSWSDIHCLNFIKSINRMFIADTDHKDVAKQLRSHATVTYFIARHKLIKLVAYLFGGAELSQVHSSKYGTVGILAKLSVLFSSLIHAQPRYFGLISLLDVDTSCIPSNIYGIVASEDEKAVPNHEKIQNHSFGSKEHLFPVSELRITKLSQQVSGEHDFTLHIEPDWEFDSQMCTVAWRHNGRIVHRSTPWQIDLAIMRHSIPDAIFPDEYPAFKPKEQLPYLAPVTCHILDLRAFEGEKALMPEEKQNCSGSDPATYSFILSVVNASLHLNASVCLVCMYGGWEDLKVVTTQEQFEEAVAENIRLIIVAPAN